MIQKDDPRLTAFVLGELEGADFAKLKTAIDASPELQQVVADIQRTVAALEESFKQETPLSLPESMSLDAMAAEKATLPLAVIKEAKTTRSNVGRWVVAASFIGIVAIGSAFYFDALPLQMAFGPSEPEIPKGAERDMESEPSVSREAIDSSMQKLGRLIQESVVPLSWHDESPPELMTHGFDRKQLNPEGDRFESITDNAFQRVSENPLSTFSIDVDTASYSKIRQSIFEAHRLPRPDAVRIEEMVNYFHYNYEGPTDDRPFAAQMEVASCPWNAKHRLARIAIQGRKMQTDQRPPCNLVFLLDTSGSMNAANKMPLVKEGMKMLLEQLDQKDHVAMVTYAGSAGLVLPSTSATKYRLIEAALDRLNAGGSTNGGQGIELAYQVARENFIKDGVNRVILCTDGDFNVGTTGTDSLVSLIEAQSKSNVFLSVMGFGMGNLNDSMLEQISGRGNGNYAFIDSRREAKKVFVDQTNGTLVTIAKDVKIQVEFNPAQVSGYRLLGYENRILAKEDFNDDQIDAGEIGAGHQVTAVYELVPAGIEDPMLRPRVEDLKYQTAVKEKDPPVSESPELLTVKMRYKLPDSDTSTYVDYPVIDEGKAFGEGSQDFRFAAAVANFGMQLRRSPYRGSWNYQSVLEVAKASKGDDVYEIRQEFIELVQQAFQLNGEE